MRNKTIRMAPDSEEGKKYLSRCVSVTEDVSSLDTLRDRTILGDSFAVLPHLPSESVDLVIADPPYNLDKQYGDTAFHRLAAEEYRTFTRRWLTEVLRILKPEGSLYVCADWKTGLYIGPLLAESALLRNRITWQREKGRGASANWKNSMEDIWFATKSDRYTFHLDAVRQRRRVLAPYRDNGVPKDWQDTPDGRFRDTCPSNFWDDITVPFWSMPENTDHPTQKPEKLLAKLILASSSPGDTVLDPFAGSGSTCVTARKLGRHFIGIERESAYCCLCEKRLADAQTDTRIQGYEDGVFWERNSRRTDCGKKTAK
ncbi:MAG: site-specific DNA-methyltransferase [Ruminococcaceae bacterium]|nr:site-specific DNA-methyltransferase [Oscillospiraceae bacterium]